MHKGVYNLLENFYPFRLNIYGLEILFGYSTKGLKWAIENLCYSIINISDPPYIRLRYSFTLLPLTPCHTPKKRQTLG